MAQNLIRTRTERIPLTNRHDYLLTLARKADHVLHVGCADWPFTERRLETGDLLHLSLAEVCNTLVGIDVEESALAVLRKAAPDLDLRRVDIESPIDLESFDLIICGEVVEHLSSPVEALRNLAKLLSSSGQLVITVPNALSFKAAARALQGREIVHPDHVAYYSPKVLQELTRRAGLSVLSTRQYLSEGSARARLANRMLRPIVAWRGGPIGDGLIACATKTDSDRARR